MNVLAIATALSMFMMLVIGFTLLTFNLTAWYWLATLAIGYAPIVFVLTKYDPPEMDWVEDEFTGENLTDKE